ncbi:cysteine-rich repeat secretory protein 3-like [Coffea eugenioides]|uniref:cysteine-rich repeat secretory protein 3-like n=1 Tax=Coffea eugenioides TaxID=49369 RepID=UPI000F60DB32|nr:cysteine-rich repeat secretory protein 3-like [Coffea eugenioides]
MDPSKTLNHLHFFLPTFVLCYCMILQSVYTSNLDYKQLVYNHCANQTSEDHTTVSLSSILPALFQELLEHSTKSKFFETNAGNDKVAVSGLFQCRGDLSNKDCYSCVNKLPEVSNKLCSQSLPARVQLSGCSIHYRADGVQTSGLQLLHKSCSGQTGSIGFPERRDAAFAAVQECIMSGQGFCEETCESIHVMAQCDGNLGACDCGECVNTAVEIAQETCGYSVSGEIYLDGCFVSYKYQGNEFNGDWNEDKGSFGRSSNKLIAIVIGGIAVVLTGAGLCYFCRSWGRKKDDFNWFMAKAKTEINLLIVKIQEVPCTTIILFGGKALQLNTLILL